MFTARVNNKRKRACLPCYMTPGRDNHTLVTSTAAKQSHVPWLDAEELPKPPKSPGRSTDASAEYCCSRTKAAAQYAACIAQLEAEKATAVSALGAELGAVREALESCQHKVAEQSAALAAGSLREAELEGKLLLEAERAGAIEAERAQASSVQGSVDLVFAVGGCEHPGAWPSNRLDCLAG